MQLARIIGTATATVKHPSLHGAALHVVQPLMADRMAADGDPQLAIDTVGAGVGDLVMITSDGRLLRDVLHTEATPARWSTIALIDEPSPREVTTGKPKRRTRKPKRS
jgi:ethanolamine utilization protein EutN